MEKQLTKFIKENPLSGTPQKNMIVPIHRWYLTPMAFSYNLVEKIIDINYDDSNFRLLEPFSGGATTLICAKKKGLNAVGLEKHKFMKIISEGKLSWNHSSNVLKKIFIRCEEKTKKKWHTTSIDSCPEFLKKCYTTNYLKQLKTIWFILQDEANETILPLLTVIMAATLRKSLCVKISTPYVQPKWKRKNTIEPLKAFRDTYTMVFKDLETVPNKVGKVTVYEKDARKMEYIRRSDFNLIISSPPYLNNIDYADTTRLELYFFEMAHSWREISKNIRLQLLTAATTQVQHKPTDFENQILSNIPTKTGELIYAKAMELKSLSFEKKDHKKCYDRMIVNYFIEMNEHLKKSYSVLKPGGKYYMVIGDSAPYGIFVPTDEIIKTLSNEIGFISDKIKIRDRGGRFNIPQKHNEKLSESLIILKKED